MTRWYEHGAAKIGVRLAGLVLLISTWPEEGLLHRLVLGTPGTEMNAAEIALAALLFLSGCAGAALTIMGPRLWQPVKLSARWSSQGSANPKSRQPLHDKADHP